MMQLKTITIIFLLISIGFSAVTITTADAYADCSFGSCEPIPIQILTTGVPISEQVYLQLDFQNDDGRIVWAKNYIKKGNTQYELNSSFDLPAGLKNFDIEFFAMGSGKFNVSVIGATTGTVYDVLDPFWNSSYDYRTNVNITSSATTLYNFQKEIILNASNLNYSNTLNDGADIRITWLNSSTEQEIDFWIETWNESANSKVWIEAPELSTSVEQFYIYYGNNTPVTTASNGTNTFMFFDGFEYTDAVTNHGWTSSGTGGTIETSTTQVKRGSRSLHMLDNDGNYPYLQRNTNFGLSIIDVDYYDIDTASQRVYFIGYYKSTGSLEFSLVYDTTSTTNYVDRHGATYSDTGIARNLNTWTQFGVQFDGTNIKKYINEVLIDTYSNTDVPDHLCIGSSWPANYFEGYWDDYRIRNYSSDTFTLAFGSEESEAVSVTYLEITLNYPTNNTNNNTATTINFGFTPFLNATINPITYANCSIWLNSTGTWALNKTNTTTISNNTVNSISIAFPQTNTSYLWNTECYANDSIGNFSSANYTLNITYDPAPYVASEHYTANYTEDSVKKYKQPQINIAGVTVDSETKLQDLTIKEVAIWIIAGIGLLMLLGLIYKVVT